MLIGLGVSTCREGLAYPCGFADLATTAALARRAEQLGFDSLWGNDHLATQQVVMETVPNPPNFYEPLIAFAYLAGLVPRVRLVVATIVAPLREPVLLAKQAATLDQVSEGRFVLGLGIGAYREEFDAIVHPPGKVNRGRMMDETIEALRVLFSNPRGAFEGRYYRFSEIELYPKPVQNPFPIYVSGNSEEGVRRAARTGNGWIVASVPSQQVANYVAQLHTEAAAVGRQAEEIEVCVQLWVAIGSSAEDAHDALERSQHFRRMRALRPEQDAEAVLASFGRSNLVGTPDQVRARIEEYRAAGAHHLGLIFLAQDAQELEQRVELFGTTVLPALR